MARFSIGLFNDSFPPIIDGVAQTVKNYATFLNQKDCDVTVITPNYHGVEDHYPFDVVRYPSIPLRARIGYRAGVPFDPETMFRLRAKKFDLMHIHSPFASSVLANTINHRPKVPTVLTYHTRFDLDLEKRLATPTMRKIATRFLMDNINAADEVWVVTDACGKTLRDLGYEKEYRVMENGTDFSRGKAPAAAIHALRETYDLREEVPVFLFVGRMMWYKNIRLILDSLKLLHDGGQEFRMIFVGDGYDLQSIQNYTADLELQDRVIFTGSLLDREYLRVFYSVADLFVFPSTFDTCGIVVKEAAACDCPSLLVRGSCASEGAVDRVSGYLVEETPASCCATMAEVCAHRAEARAIGEHAAKTLYLSWEDAVDRAYARYEEILSR